MGGILNELNQWSRQRDSNPRPTDYKSVALPTELCRPLVEECLPQTGIGVKGRRAWITSQRSFNGPR